MIIYKIQETGQATDFQFSRKCPEGYKSIPGDRIPEDISIYHEQRYIDSEKLRIQNNLCQQLLNESDKKVLPDWPYQADVEAWKTYRGKLRTIIKGDKIVTIPKKPF